MGALFLRTLHSMMLIGVSFLLLREVWTVWFDQQVYIGAFEVTSSTTVDKDENVGLDFGKRIVNA
jgi:hypothetical protein